MARLRILGWGKPRVVGHMAVAALVLLRVVGHTVVVALELPVVAAHIARAVVGCSPAAAPPAAEPEPPPALLASALPLMGHRRSSAGSMRRS